MRRNFEIINPNHVLFVEGQLNSKDFGWFQIVFNLVLIYLHCSSNHMVHHNHDRRNFFFVFFRLMVSMKCEVQGKIKHVAAVLFNWSIIMLLPELVFSLYFGLFWSTASQVRSNYPHV